MSRRTNGEDPEFGSDSFLDIIANIVGILIILIVVAGVKVARQPPDVGESPGTVADASVVQAPDSEISEPQTIVANQEVVTHTVPSEDQLQFLVDETHREEEQITQLESELSLLEGRSQIAAGESDALESTAARLQADLASLQRDVEEKHDRLKEISERSATLGTQQQQLEEENRSAEIHRAAVNRALRLARERQTAAVAQLDEVTVATRKLQEVLDTHEPPPRIESDRLDHRISPVVRAAGDTEVHFRLHDGRIAWVPLEMLLERLRQQVTSRAGIVRRFGRYEGVCGPVGGFLMKYTVARQSQSALDAMNGNPGGFRIAVTRWTTVPADTFVAETVDDALRIGSRFRQLMEATDPDTTITVWLYASDFPNFRRLREYAHGLDLRVAARPLPDGAQITGSPGGSRSSAQ